MFSRRDLIKKLGLGSLFATMPAASFAVSKIAESKSSEPYSPIHTPAYWQVPSKRREVYLWNRHFAQNDPQINAYIDFYVQKVFSHITFDLGLESNTEYKHILPTLKSAIREYFVNGDVFLCSLESRGICLDSGAPTSSKGLQLFDSDMIEIVFDVLSESKRIKFLYNNSYPYPKEASYISHIPRNKISYQAYGESIVRPLHLTLAKYDRGEVSLEEKRRSVSDVFGLDNDSQNTLLSSAMADMNIREATRTISEWLIKNFVLSPYKTNKPAFYSPIRIPNTWVTSAGK